MVRMVWRLAQMVVNAIRGRLGLRVSHLQCAGKGLLFLDVDGVLNSRTSREDGDHLPTDTALDYLSLICRETSCSIILSSTWRLDSSLLGALKMTLRLHGLEIAGCTPDLEKDCRGDRVDEIHAFLRTSGCCAQPWIAIDDLDLLSMNPKLRPVHFVRTRDSIGLTHANAAEAIEQLYIQQKGDSPSLQASLATAEAHLQPWVEAMRSLFVDDSKGSAYSLEGKAGFRAEITRRLTLEYWARPDDDSRFRNLSASEGAVHILDVGACGAVIAARSHMVLLAVDRSREALERACRFTREAEERGTACLLRSCSEEALECALAVCCCHVMLVERRPLLDAIRHVTHVLAEAEVRWAALRLDGTTQVELIRIARANQLLGTSPI